MGELDCRGRACPQPVLMTRNFLAEENPSENFCVLVDNRAAAENVKRFLENSGRACLVESRGGGFAVCASGGEGPEKEKGTVLVPKEGEGLRKILVVLANDRIGRGDGVLGRGLMTNFILTLDEMGDSLWRIVCLNEGVHLALEGAPSLDPLRQLESRGVEILVCGTCMEHYGVTDRRAVGSSTNMLDIVTGLAVADTVINL
ncbi:sulfurtransferase-like selenium metabolism protein YedF [Desulfobotulus sp. H1]|uniref:Sulfurtransferase-like selenium metabolism protein YedF n=1 Tax=Desulfobotulus pelophilus TaxID=2823377 RepID=A0ABT3N717_9BACT|nr:sulfurtransferase-like selenium metabolism protein YedF [Desulfobotulus pelophilus]MCW7753240.1 sulfurtransferase-like selenium metabolism protein YedF [Desulfobotulus pelophilus]